MVDKRSAEFISCLDLASREHGLRPEYRRCVLPLFSMSSTQWPECCGRGCAPCAQTLVGVARRVCELLDVDVGVLGNAP